MILSIAAFTIIEGQEKAVSEAARTLAARVNQDEPGTWLYKVFVHSDTLAKPATDYLVFTEGYINDQAFREHIAKGSLFSGFAAEARTNGWLVADPSNPTGLKSDFGSLDLQGTKASGSCSVSGG